MRHDSRSTAIAPFLVAALLAPFPAAAGDEPVVILDGRHFAADEAREHAELWKRWAEDFRREMRASMGTMFAPRMHSQKVVKGAPYSAEVVTETRQALADGNVISRKKVGAVYRDGEGRTRQETPSEDGERSVFVHDPATHQGFVVTPGSGRAIVTTPRVMTFTDDSRDRRVVKVGATEVRIEDGKVTVNGKEVKGGGDRTEVVTAGGKKVVVNGAKVFIDGKELVPGEGGTIVKRIERSETGDGTRREEIRVHVVRPGDLVGTPLLPEPPTPPVPPVPPVAGVLPTPPVAPLPPMPGVHSFRFESTDRLGQGVTTKLGMKEFDGVKAEGQSTVWTIPAGRIGNRNPIQVTSESWYAPDLQVTVYSRHHDPRTGESIYRLANIRRGEPAPELFRAPEGSVTPRGKRAPKA